MEKVFTAEPDTLAIKATMRLESTPPLKKAPIGTSLIILLRTAARSLLLSSSIYSFSSIFNFGAKLTCQYLREVVSFLANLI